MRLIKLSTKEFVNESALQQYFSDELPSRSPPGLFVFPRGWIREDGVEPGETILFSHLGRLRFVARAATGRMDNTTEKPDLYPHCLVIHMDSLTPTDIPLIDVEAGYRDRLGLDTSIAQCQGWPKMPDGTESEELLQELISGNARSG